MTWEETIESIRSNPEYKELVRDAYFDRDLKANVERFRSGDEFKETLALIRSNHAGNIMADIGSGNGISTISFALEGYTVYSIEPDPSLTIGAGAIRKLVDAYALEKTVQVSEQFGEATGLPDALVDIVYIRQAMHHAADLEKMMKECYRILKAGGLLVTVRDHVIYDAADKAWFLKSHPLHKFYGGENAYTANEYSRAMTNAGFIIKSKLKYFDSVINYFPSSKETFKEMLRIKRNKLLENFKRKVGPLSKISFMQKMYLGYHNMNTVNEPDERFVAGRMYTFVSMKPL